MPGETPDIPQRSLAARADMASNETHPRDPDTEGEHHYPVVFLQHADTLNFSMKERQANPKGSFLRGSGGCEFSVFDHRPVGADTRGSWVKDIGELCTASATVFYLEILSR